MTYNQTYLWLHEGGHNLGLQHGAQGMKPVRLGADSHCISTCTYTSGGQEYGDLSTPMGRWGPKPYYRCYNLPQAVRIGAASPHIITVCTSMHGSILRIGTMKLIIMC